jgi:DNA-binding MarR family transcriptional regulator/GNAT superfamily N-acetyltransferase
MAAVEQIDRAQVAAVRAFNRDYTRVAGLLGEHLLDTPHSLTEARVIYELERGSELSMLELRERIGLDPGYLSRLVSRLERRGLVAKRRSPADGRVQLLELTEEGARARATLAERAARQVEGLLEPLPALTRAELVDAMGTITGVLGTGDGATVSVRPLALGDIGWVLERHGVLFPGEYGWGPGFEELVAGVLAEFAARRDEPGNAGWIAELGGRRAGSIFCVGVDEGVAKLRLLLVEPWARGQGIGERLVGECVAFAREAGYEQLVLWTMEVLVHARPIYERAGFELVESETHTMFGPELVAQTWALTLADDPGGG